MVRSSTMSVETCKEFYRDTSINPMTNRNIDQDGPTYNTLVRMCTDMGVYPEKSSYSRPKHGKLSQIAVFVLGLGCDDEKEGNIDDLKREFEKKSGMEVSIICNKSIGSTLKGFASKFCIGVPSKSSPVIQHIYLKTQEYINHGYEIFLIGHGYGGMCVTRVAEIYNINQNKNEKIHIATMGSIYIPGDVSRTANVDIQHYMFKNDASIKCNKLRENSKLVTWMDNAAQMKQQRHFFGTGEKWNIRNSYHDLTLQLLKNKNLTYSKKNGLLTIAVLREYYISTLTQRFRNNEPVNKAFILLNYHPDKIPSKIKVLIATDLENDDKQSNIYSSRIFSEIKTKKSLTLDDLTEILDSTTGGRLM